MEKSFQDTLRKMVDTSDEYRIVLPDGTIKYLYGLGHPILNANGDVVEVVGTTVDITERKRAEEERARLLQLEAELAHINRVSMLGELTASIAHEIGQPLSGVLSNGSACIRWLAGEKPNLEEARQAASRIVRDVKRAGDIIARTRAMTKKTARPPEELDLNETIREILGLIKDEAKKNSIIISAHFADRLYPVLGDRVQLQQVALNLMMNAIESMRAVVDRERALVITTINENADHVLVTVEDSGTGIDPQVATRIFDSFYTTKPGGMGMGLSISRSIVEAHGGRLWFEARNRPGTVFHFRLSRHCQEEAEATAAGI